MILTLEYDLDKVKGNRNVKYWSSRTFRSKVCLRTHRPDTGPTAVPGPLKWSIISSLH